MKKIIRLSALFCAAALALVSCQEELDTAQFDDSAVTLASFGPNPAMRGSTVTFYGSNLDKIKEVNIPGMPAITGSDIEVVKSGKVSQIRVVLDKELPEVGYVTLKSSDGKVFQTKSELTYKEPIVFDGFTANDVVYPGDVITLKGTYMDLIQEVTFTGGQAVAVMEGSTRHEAKVTVPANAQSGVIILSDKAEIESLFYSEQSIKMGEPTVKANAKATLKAGDAITIKGEYLEMISKIAFDGAEVELEVAPADSAKKYLNEDGSITVNLPATAKNGEYKAVSFEGKEYKAGEFEAVAPVVTKVAPAPVKAGKELTITGTNLDLVTAVKFDGDDAPVFSAEEKTLKVTVSATVKEGSVELITDNGTSVKADFTLVHPTIKALAPAELYAGDEPVVVTGTDLDLAVSATLGGKAVEIEKQSADSLTLATTVSSVGGKVEITLANGETVASADEVVVKYHALVIVSSRPDGQHIGEEVVLKGENMNLVESVYVGTEKVTKYIVRKDDEIGFIMPWLKVGSYDLKFVLYNGDEEIQPAPINVLLERNIKTIWKGSQKVAWNDNDTFLDTPGSKALAALAYGGYDWASVKAGTTLAIYYNKIEAAGYSQMRVGDGNWAAIPSWLERSNGAGQIDLDGNVITQVLTSADIKALVDGNGMVICGHGYEITEVQLITEIPQEVTIWSGSQKVAWDDTASFLDTPGSKALAALAWGGYDWSTVAAGTELIVYYNEIVAAGYAQIRFGNGSWSPLPGTPDTYDITGTGSSKKSIILDDAMLAVLKESGLVVCGNGFEITSVALLPE